MFCLESRIKDLRTNDDHVVYATTPPSESFLLVSYTVSMLIPYLWSSASALNDVVASKYADQGRDLF